MGFACEVLEYERPFLGPVYAWVSAVPPSSYLEVPAMLRLILEWIARRLRSRHMLPAGIRRTSGGEIFRADAKATEGSCSVGGWYCAEGRTPGDAPWFALELTPANAGWAFAQKSPQRQIAALELFATLLCVMLFLPNRPLDEDAVMALSGGSDNAGNGFILDKAMSSKFPVCCVLMELAAQLERRRARLELQWVPRTRNQPADDLTNGVYEAFDSRRRIPVCLEELDFKVLHEMLGRGLELYQEIADAKAARGSEAAGKRRAKGDVAGRRKRLKERDPW